MDAFLTAARLGNRINAGDSRELRLLGWAPVVGLGDLRGQGVSEPRRNSCAEEQTDGAPSSLAHYFTRRE